MRLSSSYFQSLWHMNEWFGKTGKLPLQVDPAPQQLQDEDLLEMVAAGLLPLAVVDDFACRHGKGTLFGNAKFREYLKSTKYVKNATSQTELAKFLRTIQLFQKYATLYDFDWLMLAAQGYQESGLDQNVKSKVGAVGVMQVMPATGKELDVGDIRQLEPNIHAGTKYLRGLIDRYFPDAHFDPLNRCLFAFAAYNAGPARVAGCARGRPGAGPPRRQHLQVLRRVPAGGRAAEGARGRAARGGVGRARASTSSGTSCPARR